MAKYSIGSSGVNITSGRGKSKTTVTIDFSELDAWARKMQIDTPKLLEKSFAAACSGLKKKFVKIVQSGGGSSGVPKFKDFDAFTKALRNVDGNNKPLGGKLADKSSVGAWKKNGWQVIGWKDYLSNYAVAFQDALPGKAEAMLNNSNWRRWLHKRGIKDIPRTYTKNIRRVIPEPFGSYVEANLKTWAMSTFYKSLAKLMSK